MTNDPYAAPAYSSAPLVAGEVSAGVIQQLAKTKPWVRFISVMMFIGSASIVLMAIFMLALGGKIGENMPSSIGPAFWLMIAVSYLLMAGLYLYPALKLWCYASRIAILMNSRADSDLEAALSYQRSFWKFVGIIVLIFICLYALIAIGFVIALMVGVGIQHMK